MLLTPTVTDIGHRSDDAKQKRKEYRESIGRKTVPPGNLSEQVMGLLPTPTVVQDECNPDIWDERMKRIVAKGHNSFTVPLTQMAMRGMLPTPTVSDSKGSGSKEALDNRNRGENNDLGSWATLNTDGKNAKLNPQFVAEMMGFPNKWTEKPFQDDSENSFNAIDFDDFPTSYPIVQEEFQPKDITHSKWRRESIKGYGNAVVPTVVLEIFKAIEKYESLNNENQ